MQEGKKGSNACWGYGGSNFVFVQKLTCLWNNFDWIYEKRTSPTNFQCIGNSDYVDSIIHLFLFKKYSKISPNLDTNLNEFGKVFRNILKLLFTFYTIQGLL